MKRISWIFGIINEAIAAIIFFWQWLAQLWIDMFKKFTSVIDRLKKHVD